MDPVQLFPGFKLADPSYVVTDLLICVFSFYDVIHLLITAAMYASYRSCLVQE